MAKLNGLLSELTSGDELRAETAAGALAGLGGLALPALLELLGSPEADERWWAVRTLAQIPDVDHGAFVRALADPSAEVRQAAALALAGTGNPIPEALPALILAGAFFGLPSGGGGRAEEEVESGQQSCAQAPPIHGPVILRAIVRYKEDRQ